MPRAKNPGAVLTATEEGVLIEVPVTPDERALIAQFATGLLRDGTGDFDHTEAALRNRVRDAFNRARVMLEEFKKFNI